MPLEPGQKLSHYRLIEKIGEGAMGVVYAAEDTRLKRRIAMKVLPEAMAADPERLARFQREARAVAALSHPHIVTLFSVEEAEEKHFLTMELVDGESLERRIQAEKLPLSRLFDFGIALADALTAAHDKGIVHRDLKPANVMVTKDGRIKVLDFGLAKLAVESTGQDSPTIVETRDESLTQAGIVMGTVPYMSPEQVQGKSLDGRTDIFSLGVMLYELATGVRPFAGDSPAEIISSILRDSPRPVNELCGGLPRQLGRIVAHCLEKEPERRFQMALDLRNELERLREEVLIGESPGSRAQEDRGPGSIAVLPFMDMSPGKDQEYLCDGLAEDIINSLTCAGSISVAARTSAFSFKTKRLDIRDIGRKLSVESVLEGSVQKAGNRLRISVQLVNVHDGYHLWSERYDRQMDDVFAIQDEISSVIVDKLRGTAPPAEDEAMGVRHPDDVEAYQLYLKGRYHWNRRTESSLRRGIEYFENAIERAPDYVLAHVGLADSYDVLGFYSYLRPDEAFPRGKQAAQRALEMDETSAEAHVSLGYVHLYYDWDWAVAEREFLRAIELNPRYATAHQWYANLLAPIGRQEEALAQFRKALEFDPLSLIINACIGWAYYMMRDFEQAIVELRKAQELDPTFVMGRMWCGWAYQQNGMHPEAIVEFEAAARQVESAPFARANLAHAHALAGDPGKARQILDELMEQSGKRYIPAYLIGLIWTGLGDLDRAFEWLDRAYEERAHWLVFLNCDPCHDPLRADPRFDDLIRRVGLPAEGTV